jgi:hypothetical protein
MPRRILLAALAFCSLTASELAADMPASPYAGQQTRAIKALAPEDLAALRNGEGMGMAKAAELNGYPGPAHVLRSPRSSVLLKPGTTSDGNF